MNITTYFMRLSFLGLMFILPIILLGQNSTFLFIKGRITDSLDNPIPYCHTIVSGDYSLGTYSNSEGIFTINVPTTFLSDSLIFSCIGYRPQSVKLSKDMADLLIILEEEPFTLGEVVISPDTALNVIKTALKSLKDNLSKNSYILQGFFREIVRSSATYDRLVEAAVDVYDKGFKNNGIESLQFRVKEIRKSDDYIDLDWEGAIFNYLSPRNGLHGKRHESLFNSDYIRHNENDFVDIINAPLNDLFFTFVEFRIDSIVNFENHDVLRIGIYPKSEELDFLPTGFLDIRTTDYSILQMNYALKLRHGVNPVIRNLMCVPGHDFMHKTIIKYKEYKGSMYLSFLFRKSYRMQANHSVLRASQGKDGLFYDEKLFITNEIITKKKKGKAFKRRERQKSSIDLYSENWDYNKDFWETYNIIQERPLLPRIINDLNRFRDLDVQYNDQ